jgi:hypothetical protein
MKQFIALLLLIFSTALFAQSTAETDSLEKLYSAKDYTWVDEGNNIFKMRKRFSSKWGLFSRDADVQQLLPMEYDSVSFMTDYEPFSIVKRKGKYGIFLLPYEISDAAERVNCIYDKLQKVEAEPHDSQALLLAKKEGKWGQIDWLDEFEIVPFIYPSAQAVPVQYLASWAHSIIKASRAKLNADLVFLDAGNGDGVFKARNIDSQKWGMYQYLDEIKTLIPSIYDSIDFFSWNNPFTGVYNKGKVGIYTSAWSVDNAQETIPCEYDGYRVIEGNRDLFLAVQLNNQWTWIDWRSGALIGSWVASIEELEYREDDAW